MLFIGLMVAGVIAGTVSPIASAPAVFAYDQARQAGFGQMLGWPVWLSVMLLLNNLAILVVWGLLCLANWNTSPHIELAEGRENIEEGNSNKSIHKNEDRSGKQILLTTYVTVVCILTVIGWVLSGIFPKVIGVMGIVSILPILAFFGPEILTIKDLALIPWHVILLAIGGTALAVAAKHSGYMQHLADQYLDNVHWIFFLLVPGFFSIYKSHFVCAVLFLPAMDASNRGLGLDGREEGAVRYFLTFLGCQLGMGLPISGLSSLILYDMRDRQGKRRLPMYMFLTYGMVGSLIYFSLCAGIAEPLLRNTISLYFGLNSNKP
jgi:phosphate transporter